MSYARGKLQSDDLVHLKAAPIRVAIPAGDFVFVMIGYDSDALQIIQKTL